MDKTMSWREHGYSGAFYLLILSMPLSVEINRYATIGFAAVTLLTANLRGLSNAWRNDKLILLPAAYGILILVGMLYTSNFKAGLGHLERASFSVFLPLLFLIRRPSSRQVDNALSILTALTIAICTYCLIISIWKVYSTGSLVNLEKVSDRRYYYFLNNELTQPSGLSPIYLSLFVTFSIAVLLVRLIILNRVSRVAIAMVAILHVFLVLIFALSGLLATFAIWSFFVLYRFSGASFGQRVAIILVYVGVCLGALMLFYSIEPLRERFASRTQYSLDYGHVSRWNTVTIRLAVWECAMDLIKETPFVGFGTGDADDALETIYARKDFKLGVLLKLNPHSQYLQSYFMLGVLGITVVILLISVPAYVGFRHSNWLLFLFAVIFGLGFLTECMFAVQKGIVFFSMLFPLLYLHKAHKK